MSIGRVLATLATALGLAACGEQAAHGGTRVYPVALAQGTYRAAFGHGYPAADEARLMAVTAHLDRKSSRLVLTLADGSQRLLVFSSRPRDQWIGGCATMASYALNELCDLSPAPLQVESLTFATPVAYAWCSPQRMVLANGPLDESTFLAFDWTGP